MGGASKVLINVGALVSLAGAILGVVFLLSDDFVIARIECVSNAAICGEDNFVRASSTGDICQIGNLGLFDSAFTPDCADGSEYEINPLIQPFSGDPLKFGPLFPAQTNLAGIVPDGLGLSFESCESYFTGASAAALTQVISGVASQTIQLGLGEFAAGVKQTYDDTIDTIGTGTDQVFSTLGDTVLGGIAAAHAPVPQPSNYDDPFLSFATYFDFLNSTASLFPIITVSAILQAQANGFNDTNLSFAVNAGLSIGTEYQADLRIKGVGDAGMWSPFNSDVLCGAITSGVTTQCSYIAFLDFLANASSPSQLDTLQDFWVQSEAAIIDLIKTAQNVSLDRAGLEVVIANAIANNELNVFPNSLLTKAGFIIGAQTRVTPEEIIPDNFITPLTDAEPSLGLICGGAVNKTDCNLLELLVAVAPTLGDAGQALLLVAALLGKCAGEGTFSVAACLATETGFGIPQVGNLSFNDFAAAAIFGGLYSLNPGLTLQDYFSGAIDKCEDDEIDAAAIANAQVLAPSGVGLTGLGAIAGLLSVLILSGKISKIAGILVSVIALVGGLLFLAALLGVYAAPIYESVGNDGPPVDNSIVYLNGPALAFALAGIGCSIGGPVVQLVGFALLTQAGADEVAIMK